MEFLDALILGILQGITEFLPISSSGHLIIGETYLGLNVDTLKSFDVVVHVATLLAIITYFWVDFKGMIKAFLAFCSGKLKKDDKYGKLILFIVIGTIPAVIVGLFAEDIIDQHFRNIAAVGKWMLIIGILFLLAEHFHKKKKRAGLTLRKSIFIGLMQALALIPGVSRSGSTIVAGLFSGIERSEAARFSFLLGIPAIAGAGLLTALKIPENGGFGIDLSVLGVGFISSFVFGILSISFLMKFLKKHSLNVFAFYLIILGSSIWYFL